jgi:tRNA 2-thiouridine synthesizing protein D
MIFSLAVYAPPYSSQASHTAYEFAKALLHKGHTLHRIFFYHDGVHNASSLGTPPQDLTYTKHGTTSPNNMTWLFV